MKLRDYQEQAILKTINVKNNSIIVAPTGSGKSIIIVELVKKMKAKKTVVFQPTANILKQNLSHYKNSTGKDAAVMSASGGGHEVGKVTFSTIGTAKNRVEEFLDTDLIILDEAHNVDPVKMKTMYQKFFKAIKYKGPVIGLTATPSRNYRKFDTKKMQTRPSIDVLTQIGGKNKFWKSFSYIVDIQHLIDNGYLLKPEYVLKEGIDTSKLKLTADGSNFTKESIRIFDEENYQNIFEVCKIAYQERNSIICFVDTIEVAKQLAESLQKEGFVSDYMSSERSQKENQDCLEQFRNEPKMILTNCNMVTEGVDVRKCDGIILGTPTSSLNRYIQRVGRALRIPEEGKTKLTPIIYDIAQSSKRFAPVEDIVWTNKEIKVRNSNRILSGFQEGQEFISDEKIKQINKNRNQHSLFTEFEFRDIFGQITEISDEFISKKGNPYKKIEIDLNPDDIKTNTMTLMIMAKNYKHFTNIMEGDTLSIRCSIKKDSDFGFAYFPLKYNKFYI